MSDTNLSEKLKKIANEIESLTIVEMAELAKYLEEKFGVSPMAAMPATTAVANQPTEQKTEEETTVTVVLTTVGSNKLAVIKAVREILPNLGLMEAKKLVESVPQELLKDVKRNQAEEVKKKIETAGGKVEFK